MCVERRDLHACMITLLLLLQQIMKVYKEIINNLVNSRDESRILFSKLKHKGTQGIHGCCAQVRARVQCPYYGMNYS